jgi:VWFA-related protein
MRSRPACARAAFGAFALLLAYHHLPASPFRDAQESAIRQEEPSRLAYDVSVTVKNVEVIVRGKDGRRITGLRLENFKVFEDGLPKNITNFHEATGMRPARVSKDDPGAAEPGTGLPAAVPEAIQNRIVFFFDNAHLHPMNRNWIIKKLQSFITRNFERGTTNQAMIVFLDRRLDVIQDFTSGAVSLLSAIEGLRDRASDALTRKRSWDEVQQEITLMASRTTAEDTENYQLAASYAHGFIEEEMNQLAFSLRSLQALGSRLGGIKGRKILIYASDRMPLNPAEEVFRFISRLFPSMSAETESLVYDASQLFHQTVALCNAQEISVYALQAEDFGLLASSADKANWSVEASGLRPINPGTARHNDGLETVSRETGGSMITAKRDHAAGFEILEDDLSHFYSLGYASNAPADDAFHVIDVKVVDAGEDCVLRFRTGYLKNSPDEAAKSHVIARLFIPQKDNPLDARVQALPPEKQPFGQVKMRFKLLIPIGRLTLRPSGSEHAGAIKVLVAMLDSKKRWSDPAELLQDIRIPDQDLETARGRFYPYVVEISVNPERYTVSLAVRDVFGQQTGYIQFDQDVR